MPCLRFRLVARRGTEEQPRAARPGFVGQRIDQRSPDTEAPKPLKYPHLRDERHGRPEPIEPKEARWGAAHLGYKHFAPGQLRGEGEGIEMAVVFGQPVQVVGVSEPHADVCSHRTRIVRLTVLQLHALVSLER